MKYFIEKIFLLLPHPHQINRRENINKKYISFISNSRPFLFSMNNIVFSVFMIFDSECNEIFGLIMMYFVWYFFLRNIHIYNIDINNKPSHSRWYR